MTRSPLKSLIAPVALATFAALLPAHAAPARPKPRITAAQAEVAALKKIPGKAQSAKYEFEDGHWQYAVIVTNRKGQMYEVEVNSTTGRVTDTERTSAAEEAREAAADKKAAMKKTSGYSTARGASKESDEKGESR